MFDNQKPAQNPDKMGALWISQNKPNMLSGNVICPHCNTEQKVIAFDNSQNKKNPKAPDIAILKARPQEQQNTTAQQQNQQPQQQPMQQPMGTTPEQQQAPQGNYGQPNY